MADGIEGDWYLQLGEQKFDPRVLPRYTLRGGRVLQAGRTEAVGSYLLENDEAKIVIGEDLLVVRLPGPTENAMSGTMSLVGVDDVLAEPAVLLRAKNDAAER